MENSKHTSCACGTSQPLKKDPATRSKKMSVLNIITAVVVFLFPKCPFCWATYASLFSFVGLDVLTYNSNWIYSVFAVFLIVSFISLRKHYLNKSWGSLIIYSIAIVILVLTYYFKLNQTWWLYIVLTLIALSNLSKRYVHKLRALFKRPFLITPKI